MRVVNRMDEDALIKALEATYGIEHVTTFIGARATLHEQATTFQRASAVVSFHGAGLANVVYCRPGTLVVEVPVTSAAAFAFFHHLSLALSHRYVSLSALAVQYLAPEIRISASQVATVVEALRDGGIHPMVNHNIGEEHAGGREGWGGGRGGKGRGAPPLKRQEALRDEL